MKKGEITLMNVIIGMILFMAVLTGFTLFLSSLASEYDVTLNEDITYLMNLNNSAAMNTLIEEQEQKTVEQTLGTGVTDAASAFSAAWRLAIGSYNVINNIITTSLSSIGLGWLQPFLSLALVAIIVYLIINGLIRVV